MNNTVLTDEQKDRFVSDICEYGTGFVAPLYSVVEAIEQAVLQSEQVQEWRKDAGRYRWLRNDCLDGYFGEIAPVVFNTDDCFKHNDEALMGEDLDDAIDAAMEKQL